MRRTGGRERTEVRGRVKETIVEEREGYKGQKVGLGFNRDNTSYPVVSLYPESETRSERSGNHYNPQWEEPLVRANAKKGTNV